MSTAKIGKLKFLSANWFYLFLVFVILVGVVLRCIDIDRRVYWGDEIVTSLRMSGYTMAEVVKNLTSQSIVSISDLMVYQHPSSTNDLASTINGLIVEEPQHAPIYFFLTRLWIQLFNNLGNSVVVIRSFSVFVNLLSFACLYWLCLELFSLRSIGIIAVAMVAVSPFNLVYAQEARPPALWFFVIILSSALFLRAIRLNTKLSWIAYAISVILSLYTFLFSLLVFASHGIYILLMQRFRLTKAMISYLISIFVSILAFIPWLIVVVSNLKVINNATGWSSEKIGSLNLLRLVVNNLRDVFFSIGDGFIYLTFFLLILIGFSLYFLWRKTSKHVWLFVFSIIGVNIVVLLLPDVLNGGTLRSAASRYFIASYLGLYLSLAYLFHTYATSSVRYLRAFWQVIAIFLLILGIISCLAISKSELSFNQATYRNVITLAKNINKYEYPLILANSKYSNNIIGLIGLSYRLKSDTQFKLIDNTSQKIIPESSKSIFVYGGDFDLILNMEKEKYEPQLIFDDRNNQCCSENLWYLKQK